MRLGLPNGIRVCLFDLDGVLTQTAKVHAAAWKEMFDAYLHERPEPFQEFRLPEDYEAYVDG
jgi:beta-phosphoglucomutase-like phosphatase (HAD superfamily)